MGGVAGWERGIRLAKLPYGVPQVLAGAGLRHAVIRTAGGALDCALDPGTALEVVEVRQAAHLDVDPGTAMEDSESLRTAT